MRIEDDATTATTTATQNAQTANITSSLTYHIISFMSHHLFHITPSRTATQNAQTAKIDSFPADLSEISEETS